MKIARAIPAPTTLIAPGRSFGTADPSRRGGAASDLTAFLSLVTGFLEKNPTATLGRIMPLPYNPSDAARASVSKDKSKDLTSGLNKDTEGGLIKEPTGGLNKDSKNGKKEESLALPQPARPLPIALAFPAKMPVALGFPTPQPGLAGWGEQSSWESKRQHRRLRATSRNCTACFGHSTSCSTSGRGGCRIRSSFESEQFGYQQYSASCYSGNATRREFGSGSQPGTGTDGVGRLKRIHCQFNSGFHRSGPKAASKG